MTDRQRRGAVWGIRRWVTRVQIAEFPRRRIVPAVVAALCVVVGGIFGGVILAASLGMPREFGLVLAIASVPVAVMAAAAIGHGFKHGDELAEAGPRTGETHQPSVALTEAGTEKLNETRTEIDRARSRGDLTRRQISKRLAFWVSANAVEAVVFIAVALNVGDWTGASLRLLLRAFFVGSAAYSTACVGLAVMSPRTVALEGVDGIRLRPIRAFRAVWRSAVVDGRHSDSPSRPARGSTSGR